MTQQHIYSVFVLMPFSTAFEAVYHDLIQHALKNSHAATFVVNRADDFKHQHSILKDIISGIFHSDLIIADLTDNNANVYYELGLAHAFNKPVILLTQTIEHISFDVRQYRILEYSTHFRDFVRAREQLTSLVSAFAGSNLQFGNPVSEYLPEYTAPSTQTDSDYVLQDIVDDHVNFLRTIESITNTFNKLSISTSDLHRYVETDLYEPVSSAARDLQNILSHALGISDADLELARGITTDITGVLEMGTMRLAIANAQYRHSAIVIENSIGTINELADRMEWAKDTSEMTAAVNGQCDAMRVIRSDATQLRRLLVTLGEQQNSLPKFERGLAQAIESQGGEIEGLCRLLDRSVAIVTRGIFAWEGRPGGNVDRFGQSNEKITDHELAAQITVSLWPKDRKRIDNLLSQGYEVISRDPSLIDEGSEVWMLRRMSG